MGTMVFILPIENWGTEKLSNLPNWSQQMLSAENSLFILNIVSLSKYITISIF